jgi:hypothetical protein
MLTTSLSYVSRLSRKCGSLKVSQPYGSPRPVTGIASLFVSSVAFILGLYAVYFRKFALVKPNLVIFSFSSDCNDCTVMRAPLYDAVNMCALYRRMGAWWMRQDLEGSVRGLIEALSGLLPELTKECHQNPQDCRCSGLNSNQIPPEYQSRTLLVENPGRRTIFCENPKVAFEDAWGMERNVRLWSKPGSIKQARCLFRAVFPFALILLYLAWYSGSLQFLFLGATKSPPSCHSIRSVRPDSMELSPPQEATSHAATQELPNILWNPKVHYRLHKSPPLVSIPSQINPVRTTPSCSSKIDFNIVHSPTYWSS